MKQQEFFKKRLGEVNDWKNDGLENMLENDEVGFGEVEGWGNKCRDAVARYEISMTK